MMRIKNVFFLAFFGLYLVSTGASLAVFNTFKKDSSELLRPTETQKEGASEEASIDVSGPKTESCLLNGEKFTKAEKEAWSKVRPLTVMIENHEEARPQSGLTSADIVYEAVAEGGITRFVAVFFCRAQAKEAIIGPVRSARVYYLDWVSEYGKTPLYAHVGGAHCDATTSEGCLNGAKADALGLIGKYGWGGENDLNQFSIGYPTFWRDYERLGRTVATEHTMYSTTRKLWAVGKERGWTNKDSEDVDWQENFVPWKFKESVEADEEAPVIELGFWEGYKAYNVKWEYNQQAATYLRSNGGQPHLDLNNNKQLEAKNVIIIYALESNANDGYPGNLHLLYKTIGGGNALVFQGGKVIKATWEKESRTERTKFYDRGTNKEIELIPGQIWVITVPLEAEVTF